MIFVVCKKVYIIEDYRPTNYRLDAQVHFTTKLALLKPLNFWCYCPQFWLGGHVTLRAVN